MGEGNALKTNTAAMASDAAPIVHFEVYVRERTQWMLQVRFRADQKEQAINEAKLIEKTLGLGVKVVRETYYPDTNTCEEVTAYVSQKLTAQERSFSPLATVNTVRPRSVRRGAAGGGGGGGGGGGVPVFDGRQGASGENLGALLIKLLAIIIVAFGVAVTGTAAISNLLGKAGAFGVVIAPQYFPKIIFSSFASLFLMVAVPLSLIFVGGLNIKRKRRGRRAPVRPATVRVTAPRGERNAMPDLVLEEEVQTTLVVVQEEERPPPRGFIMSMMRRMNSLFGGKPPIRSSRGEAFETPYDADGAYDRPPPDELSTAVAETPIAWDLQTEIAAEPPAFAEPPPAAAPPPEPVATASAPESEPVGLERHRMTTVRFLGDLLARLKTIRPTLDAYNRFGVDLMMAGAVERLAEENTIPEDLARHLLRECVELLGTKKAMAQTFCDKVEEYLQETRYLHLVQAGRDMMGRFLSDSPDAFAGLAPALEQWNKPVAKPSGQQIVTVLFTDMVGSTDMTQAKGDAAAQEVVRRHNSIVRQALAEFDGREVKHTGDGIMASFASTANAVDAAIAIQLAVHAHNRGTPDIPVHLRIGINAGEPIQEEDDLFGTTVQLAARICAKAEPDQVLCSNVVRELSSGKSRRFVPLGEQMLKGFRDPVSLFEVVWLELSLDAEATQTVAR